jgi:antitoxin component YwqK of YwqJK toxin-antitoxin module
MEDERFPMLTILRNVTRQAADTVAEGVFVRSWPNGEDRERGRMTAGSREGSWRWFSEEGRLVEEASYRRGLLHGPVTKWFATGVLKEETQRAWGMLNGPFARFHPNGRLAEDGEHIEGRVHRAYCRWWPNGRKRIEGAFNHGVPVGEWRAWDGHGNHLYQGAWRDDLRTHLGADVRPAMRREEGETPVPAGFNEGEYANVA